MKKILIKASGDVLRDSRFVRFVKAEAKGNKVVVICGGGTQISKALTRAGYQIRYNHHGRVAGRKEKILIEKVLKKERKSLQGLLGNVEIIVPVLKAGSVKCHINADNLVKAYYLGFDDIYVFTLDSRISDKKKAFRDYPKVKIRGIKK